MQAVCLLVLAISSRRRFIIAPVIEMLLAPRFADVLLIFSSPLSQLARAGGPKARPRPPTNLQD